MYVARRFSVRIGPKPDGQRTSGVLGATVQRKGRKYIPIHRVAIKTFPVHEILQVEIRPASAL
jgi:hypothetical protein